MKQQIVSSCKVSRGIFSACWVLIVVAGLTSAAYGQDRLSYNRDIKPILADKCFACHGLDEQTREAGLRLDTFLGATSEESGSAAIVPGDLEESELWARITSDDPDDIMPPPNSHKELTADEIAKLKRWIEEGAEYEEHWSFQPIVRLEPPTEGSENLNPIDGFIREKLKSHGLGLAPNADRAVLIRRVAFTLTGLPPTVEDVNQFLADESPDAYEAMVDRFLASPHYGEEMARHWLDLARYGDTHGLHLDNERQMWAYRDWVVKSFNRNQSFDQFTIEQLAGDLLPEPTTEQLVATGFNRCNVTTSEGGAIDAEFRYRYAVDRTSTMAETWLGLTAGCAVCHDHKFDPISTKEFYSLYAFFNSAADPAMDGNALLTNPILRLTQPTDEERLAEYDRQIVAAEAELEQLVAQVIYNDPATMPEPPAAMAVEQIWFDEEFPTGGRISHHGHATQFVSQSDGAPTFKGTRALKRTANGLGQDVWEGAPSPLVLPQDGILFAWVYLDPENPPQAVMLQFFRNGWNHRAVWGDINTIPWGRPNTPERFHVGSLPELGVWAKLEVALDKVGLTSGDQLTGFATTQIDGTVFWDYVGVEGVSDPTTDPTSSFTRWWEAVQGKDLSDLPANLKQIAKAGPNAEAAPELIEQLRRHFLKTVCNDTKETFAPKLAQIRELRQARSNFDQQIPRTFIFRNTDQPRESFVMQRGQYDQPGEKVEPGVPAVLPPLKRQDETRSPNRLDLAEWIVSDENPLTARVIVNRYWQQVFGVGLVKSSGDFGTQGELPSHPELMDFLASEFRDSGWDVKALMRLMLTSDTFRQNSSVTPELLELDPENRLLARGPRFRLDAEQIRDNVLFVSGLMDKTFGGKGVKPYQPPNVWEPVGYIDSNTRNYKQDSGSALYRRSLYTFFKRTVPPPFMVNFDAPNREQPCSRRERSNTPLQALQLLNDVQHVEAARALAERVLLAEQADSDESKLVLIYKIVLAREPRPVELEILMQQLSLHVQRYEVDGEGAEALVSQGESKRDSALPAARLAAFTLISSTVLNLDETVNRN
ncbi:MAG: PSD1 domain-containing protein [Pirellulaceae bacterium]|nr:PSD1 domain-containing protein [Pirellulaceae bacterium]